MTDPDLLALIQQVQGHEGLRLEPYRDSVGALTIGYGTNIEHISEEEADLLLGHRLNVAFVECSRTFPWFRTLDSVRQAALTNATYNLGLTRLLTFRRMIAALAAKDYDAAARELLDSEAARKAPGRYAELAGMVRSGEWA